MFEQQRIELERAKSQYSTAVKSIDSAVRGAISRDPDCQGEADALRGDYCVVPDEAVMPEFVTGAIEEKPSDVRDKQFAELEQAHKQLLIDHDALVHQYKALVAEQLRDTTAAVADEGNDQAPAAGEEQGS